MLREQRLCRELISALVLKDEQSIQIKGNTARRQKNSKMAFKNTELNFFIFLHLPFVLTRNPKGYRSQYRNKEKQHKG